MPPLRSVAAAVLIVLLAGGSIAAGAGRLVGVARLGRELAGLPDFEERRLRLFGAWYADVQQLRARIPADAAVDFVMVAPGARDIAVLAAAELQPRDVRLFDGWDAWRQRRRAELLHDARAANAAPGPPPGAAAFVVAVDATKLRLITPPR